MIPQLFFFLFDCYWNWQEKLAAMRNYDEEKSQKLGIVQEKTHRINARYSIQNILYT